MTLQAAQAQSGKWHILGPRGCLAVEADRIKSKSIQQVRNDQRRREWCSYCEQELRIIELERKVERLESILEATDPMVFVDGTHATVDTWHADPECSHAPANQREIALSRAESIGLDGCAWCVTGVGRADREDREHYHSLLAAAADGAGQEGI